MRPRRAARSPGDSSMASSISGVSETLMFPLYLRHLETQRPDAILKDTRSSELARQLDYDFSRFGRLEDDWASQAGAAIRTAIYDDGARAFLARHPRARVINLGAGLCTRFFRLDNGQARWIELDLPAVVELRRQFLPDSDRHPSLACSALDRSWIGEVKRLAPAPGSDTLLIAEGLAFYFELAEFKRLLSAARDGFPGGRMMFDLPGPLIARSAGRSKAAIRLGAGPRWGLADFREMEGWAPGLRLLDEWNYLDRHPERWRWMRILGWFPPVKRQLYRVAHLALGPDGA